MVSIVKRYEVDFSATGKMKIDVAEEEGVDTDLLVETLAEVAIKAMLSSYPGVVQMSQIDVDLQDIQEIR